MVPVLHVPAFQDNYIWLIGSEHTSAVAIVDPGDADPVLDALERQRLTPVAILCTHHHGDHVGGVPALLHHYRIPVYGPATEPIPGLDHPLREADTVELDALGLRLAVLEVPGHTRGHIAYYGHGMLLCGDTLFSAGCGRLFEGTPEQLHRSLGRLAALPGATRVYCAHEYTLANLAFARHVEPGNVDVQRHQAWARGQRARGRSTLPSTIDTEQRINPFLRAGVAAVHAAAEAHDQRRYESATEVFAALRRWKDGYRA